MDRIEARIQLTIERFSDDGDLSGREAIPAPLLVSALGVPAFLRAWQDAGRRIVEAIQASDADAPDAETVEE